MEELNEWCFIERLFDFKIWEIWLIYSATDTHSHAFRPTTNVFNLKFLIAKRAHYVRSNVRFSFKCSSSNERLDCVCVCVDWEQKAERHWTNLGGLRIISYRKFPLIIRSCQTFQLYMHTVHAYVSCSCKRKHFNNTFVERERSCKL